MHIYSNESLMRHFVQFSCLLPVFISFYFFFFISFSVHHFYCLLETPIKFFSFIAFSHHMKNDVKRYEMKRRNKTKKKLLYGCVPFVLHRHLCRHVHTIAYTLYISYIFLTQNTFLNKVDVYRQNNGKKKK